MTEFIQRLRDNKSYGYDLHGNSTARKEISVDFWGQQLPVYANANLSVYSAQKCNARCPFCVEELRPASRGAELLQQKRLELNDKRYFDNLQEVIEITKIINPSISITGGEASKDPRLPAILRVLQQNKTRKRTITTNGSGLLDNREGKKIIDWVAETGVRHLNISRAHYDHQQNAKIMRFTEGLEIEQLVKVVALAKQAGTRVRLSCVLLDSEIDSLTEVKKYLDFASLIGVDNVIFRQLMKTDPRTSAPNFVVLYSDKKRVLLENLLNQISNDSEFSFIRQIVGYYYYVEVWKYADIDVVFEEADLAQLENTKREGMQTIHELIFHPNAQLCSTWQPWDGILGPNSIQHASLRAA